MDNKIKKSIIVEGGAMKGIFASGVLDSFFDNKYNDFDFAIGVSSGAINLASWLSGQRGRSKVIITNFARKENFISYRKFLFGGNLIDLDWLWKIKQCKYPLDVEHLIQNKIQFYVVTSDITNKQTLYELINVSNCDFKIKASCALPFLYKNKLFFNNSRVLDGGIFDPIPVIKAYEMGSRDITVILSRKQGYVRNISMPKCAIKFMAKEFFDVEHIINQHNEAYNRAINFIMYPPKDCKINAIYPDCNFNVGLLTKNINHLNFGYNMGYRKGVDFINKANNNKKIN